MQKKEMMIFILVIIMVVLLIFLGIKQMNKSKSSSDETIHNEAIYQKKIDTIVLRYVPFYNLETAEALNEITEGGYIDIIELKLEGTSFSEVKKLIKNLTPSDFDMTSCNCVYMMDMAEIIINDEYVIRIGDTFGLAGYKNNENKTLVNVSMLYDEIEKIMNENSSHVFESLSADTIQIEKNNHIVDIRTSIDKETLLDNLNYVEVNNVEDYLTYDTISSIVHLDNDRRLYIYQTSIMGYLWNANGNSSYVVMSSKTGERYETVVDTIYQKYQSVDFELQGGLKEGESCVQAIEPFVVGGKEVCHFNCMISDSYRVKFQNGQVFSIKEALEKKLVTIEELQRKGLPCH